MCQNFSTPTVQAGMYCSKKGSKLVITIDYNSFCKIQTMKTNADAIAQDTNR